MSEPAAEPEAPETAAPRAKPSLIVLLMLAANLALSGGALAMSMRKAKAGDGSHAKRKLTKEVTGPLIALDPFIVNLNEPGSSRYLKVQLQVEVADAAAAKKLERSKQLIRDEILRYLSGLKVADTLGPDNKDEIRGELETAVGRSIGAEKVHRMIFSDFVVQ